MGKRKEGEKKGENERVMGKQKGRGERRGKSKKKLSFAKKSLIFFLLYRSRSTAAAVIIKSSIM